MKLTLKAIYDAIPALDTLSKQVFPGNIAYRIQRNIRKLKTDDTREYEKQLRDICINKYECVSEGDRLKPKDPKRYDEFKAETDALGAVEIDVDILLIPLDSVKQITPADLFNLEWMFEGTAEPVPSYHQKPDKPSKKPKAARG